MSCGPYFRWTCSSLGLLSCTCCILLFCISILLSGVFYFRSFSSSLSWPFLLLETTLIGPLQMLWMSLSLNSTSVELLIRHILILCFKTLLTSVAKLYYPLYLNSTCWRLAAWEFCLCLCWLGIQLVGENSLCPICGCQSDTMGTIMSHVEEMLTSFLDITVSVMSFLLLPVQPHCHLGRNCQP